METSAVKGKRAYFHPLDDNAPEKKSFSLRLGGGKVSSKALSQFTSQLATLQGAGLPIVRCLRVLAGQYKPGPLKKTIGQVADDVEGGNSLSEAFAKHPRVFGTLYTSMVKAGEAGGILDTILRRLADFLDKAENEIGTITKRWGGIGKELFGLIEGLADSTASMLDMQAWYSKHKMSNSHFPAERLVQTAYVEEAVKKLGPFKLENPDSKLAGCR